MTRLLTRESLRHYFNFYNRKRLHSSLDTPTPGRAYYAHFPFSRTSGTLFMRAPYWVAPSLTPPLGSDKFWAGGRSLHPAT
jgi:hypothetical protein